MKAAARGWRSCLVIVASLGMTLTSSWSSCPWTPYLLQRVKVKDCVDPQPEMLKRIWEMESSEEWFRTWLHAHGLTVEVYAEELLSHEADPLVRVTVLWEREVVYHSDGPPGASGWEKVLENRRYFLAGRTLEECGELRRAHRQMTI